uniref:Uncharacterized protein n=1 Tax=Onchocerca volvulus TaxID=6282 RepID=A0A8R1Y7K1_ONCVO
MIKIFLLYHRLSYLPGSLRESLFLSRLHSLMMLPG